MTTGLAGGHDLFFAIDFDGVGNEACRALTVFIDIFLKTLVADVHLTETCEDIIGAMIKIRRDIVLQLFYKQLLNLLLHLSYYS